MKSICNFVPLAAAFSTLVSTLAFAADETKSSAFEELVVTSSRIEQPLREVATSVSVITRDDLDFSGYNSLAAVLRNELSVGVSNNGGVGQQTALRIRGEEGYRTLLLIDGVDVSDASGTQKGPLFQNITSSYDIGRIEVLRGPQGFMYGADAGGVINIITQDFRDGMGGKLTAEAGSFGSTNMGGSLFAGNEIAGLRASLSRFDTDGFSAQQADTQLRDKDGSENTTLHIKGGWNLTEDLEATLVYRNIDLSYGYDGCFDSSTRATVHACTGHNDQENLKLSLGYSSGDFTHSVSISDAASDRVSYTHDVLSFRAQSDSTQIEYMGSWVVSSAHSVVYGVDYEDDSMSHNSGALGDRDQTGVFAEYQADIGRQLFVTAGLRYDDNSDFGKHTSGRVSAAYLIDLGNASTLKLRATAGTGFRAPSLAEISYNGGPTQFGTLEGVVLGEETSQGFDLGVDWLLANSVSVQLTYFSQTVEDEIFYEFDLATFNDGYRQGVGESNSEGIEVAFDVPLGDALVLEANFTYNDTENSNGLQRARRPEKLANISLRYAGMDGRFSILGSVRLSRDAQDRFATPLDNYELIDISVNYDLNDQVELFGRVENLANEDYVEVIGFNTAERAAYLGARYKF